MWLTSALVLGAAALSGVAAQQKNPFVAKWEINETSPNPKSIYFLDVVDKGDHLEAKFLDRVAHATPVAWIRVEGKDLVWQRSNDSDSLPKPSCGPIFRGHLEGDKLVGTDTTPGEPCPAVNRGARAGAGAPGGARADAAPAPAKAAPAPVEHHWVGTHQPVFPPSNANGNHTYGTPVVIVGPGKGKEMWSGLTPATWQNECEDRWTFENGTMKNAVGGRGEKPTCNIFTKDKFQNFKAEADVVLDQGQNSGFYIRGRYELQLMLPNPNGRGGESTYPGQLMDVYGWTRANAPSANPSGQPQHLEAVVVGDHITVLFNGKKVHDNAVLYSWTGGALDNKLLEPGPIMIQGDHSLVTVTKLVITPITKAGM
jgi:hypothetical protein